MKAFFGGLLLACLLFFSSATQPLAQNEPYIINNFHSDVTVNQDASITIVETLDVDFRQQRHGIFRYIPTIYRTNNQVINSRLQVQSVRDKEGKRHKYEVSREGDNVEIKIGDPDEYVTGMVSYVITYRARNIVQRYGEYDELYWNVLGRGWDTRIQSASATVNSPFASITDIQCFAGLAGSSSNCLTRNFDEDSAEFAAGSILGNGQDMTIVLAFDPNNQLTFARSLGDLIADYWGYGVVALPIIVIAIAWVRFGRDKRYVGDNIYYSPDIKAIETKPIWRKREFLPLVYSPINGLTPAEVGTLIDERVDIHDIVAEIIELGRLGLLKIEKIDKKFAKDDYIITKLKGDTSKLRDYQKYLYDSIFSYADEKDQVKLSQLKKKFYTKLETFRNKLYKHLQKQNYFVYRPDQVRIIWMVIAAIMLSLGFVAAISFLETTGDFLPFVILLFSIVPTLLLAFNMPRRTPAGYALFRQTKGLAFYLGKGKWRQEVNEKHLFLEEMLPLAISLGVVKQLARDMQELGVQSPSYFNVPGSAWASSLNSFNSTASSALVTGASSSGSWSGGSGFSGGSSGGGFGGGGGGSW